jgi:hypothetical protein
MFPTFFVDQCMYNDQKPSKSYAKPSYNYMLVRNKVYPASCFSQHEIHVNVTPFFLNRQCHSLVIQELCPHQIINVYVTVPYTNIWL